MVEQAGEEQVRHASKFLKQEHVRGLQLIVDAEQDVSVEEDRVLAKFAFWAARDGLIRVESPRIKLSNPLRESQVEALILMIKGYSSGEVRQEGAEKVDAVRRQSLLGKFYAVSFVRVAAIIGADRNLAPEIHDQLSAWINSGEILKE